MIKMDLPFLYQWLCDLVPLLLWEIKNKSGKIRKRGPDLSVVEQNYRISLSNNTKHEANGKPCPGWAHVTLFACLYMVVVRSALYCQYALLICHVSQATCCYGNLISALTDTWGGPMWHIWVEWIRIHGFNYTYLNALGPNHGSYACV